MDCSPEISAASINLVIAGLVMSNLANSWIEKISVKYVDC